MTTCRKLISRRVVGASVTKVSGINENVAAVVLTRSAVMRQYEEKASMQPRIKIDTIYMGLPIVH